MALLTPRRAGSRNLWTVCITVAIALFPTMSNAQDASPSPVPTAEIIHLDACTIELAADDSAITSVTFTNVSAINVTAVRFRFYFQDAFGKIGGSSTGTITGKFMPHKQAKPMRALLTREPLYGPEFPYSPAWDLYNPLGHDMATGRCKVDAVKSEDGSVVDYSPQ